MTLRRRIRNLHRCSLRVTRRSPTQTKSFHLSLLRVTSSAPLLNHQNGPTRHWRNRTIPNQNNNALLRAFKFLYTAAKQAGTECKKLMTTIPGPQYYRCHALYLQHRYGNHAGLELQSPGRNNLKDRELNAWVELYRMIAQDALAELIKMSQELSWEHPALFQP